MRVANDSDFGFEAAGAGQAPAAHGFEEGEEAGDHENQSHRTLKIHDDDSGDQAEAAHHPAGDASAMIDVGPEKSLHTLNLARPKPVSNSSLGKMWGWERLALVGRGAGESSNFKLQSPRKSGKRESGKSAAVEASPYAKATADKMADRTETGTRTKALAGTMHFYRRWAQMNADKNREKTLIQSRPDRVPSRGLGSSGMASSPYLRLSAAICGGNFTFSLSRVPAFRFSPSASICGQDTAQKHYELAVNEQKLRTCSGENAHWRGVGAGTFIALLTGKSWSALGCHPLY